MTNPTEQDNLYRDYHEWKDWVDLFTYTADHAGYFRYELRDLKVAGADVLEIGFGSGACLAWMSERGASLAGTELSERSCEAARARGIEVLPTNLPAAAAAHAGRFDTIVAFDVFEHLPMDAVSEYLAACETMLRPGGRLLLRFPNSQSPFGLYAQAGDPTHQVQLSCQVIELLSVERRLEVLRYGGSYLYTGPLFSPRGIKRRLRIAAQTAIGAVLRFTYATSIPYDPVVVVVLERKG